jgi:cysteinyl-tRNA synthetase
LYPLYAILTFELVRIIEKNSPFISKINVLMRHTLSYLLVGIILASVACNFSGISDSSEENGGKDEIPSSNSGVDRLNLDEYIPEYGKNTPGALFEVEHWLYYIDANLEDETLNQIVDSAYDMVVIDYIVSEGDNSEYPLAGAITGMHNADHPKLVIAYIDIGEAEDYRASWQPGWEIGNPEWIIALDPDGWEGNYPVAYWHDGYRDIWLGEGGYLQGILDAGFDGIYLDWIEAYSDENVIASAEDEGVDPLLEMVWWVGDIADFTRAQDPEFIVIAQNTAELAQYDVYVNIIDAIAQEQVWFDGGGDDEPPGDCPLPATDEDVETEDYYNSLPPECRRLFDYDPKSTFHISSEEYITYLTVAQDKGLKIFTVDYAIIPTNIDYVVRTSRSLGFVPFVSNRALDRYVEP